MKIGYWFVLLGWIGMPLVWVHAQEPSVYSDDYVAFIQVQIPAHGFAIVSKPLVPFEGQDDSLNASIGDQLPGGEAYFYNAATGNYKIDTHYIFGDFSTWGVNDPNATRLGSAFWLKNNSDEDKTVVLTGYVPKESQTSKDVGAPFDLVAPVYPEPVDVTQIDGFANPQPGAVLYKYHIPTGTYQLVQAFTVPGFGTFWENSMIIEPGEGFWSHAENEFTFTQDKPYPLP
jgi:hypothetical protein